MYPAARATELPGVCTADEAIVPLPVASPAYTISSRS